MPDFLMLGSSFACAENVKDLFEKSNVYGVEFFPINKITDNKGKIIEGYFAMHIWNKLPAIDKKNYSGGKLDRRGYIFDLKKFSLDNDLLESLPLDQKLIFNLKETPSVLVIHESIYELLHAANLTGMLFFRVDDWDEDAMFK